MIDGGLWPILRDHMPHVHWQRIESGLTAGGIPDLNGCLRGQEAWLELKGTDAWAVAFRPFQISWLERRARAGGRVFLLTRRRCAAGPRRLAADELWVHRAEDARHVEAGGLRKAPPPVMRLDGGPSQWLWPAVEELVFGDRPQERATP